MEQQTNENTAAFENRFAYDTLTFYYLSLPQMLVGQILGAFLLSAMQLGIVDTSAIGIWLLLNIVMFLYRSYHYLLFRKTPESEKLHSVMLWLDRYYTNVLLSGIVWGCAALLLFPDGDMMHQMVLMLFLFAVGFSSMGVLATKNDLLLTYVLVMYGPLIWKLFAVEGSIYDTIGFAVMSLVLLMMLVANYYGRMILSGLKNRQDFIDIKTSHEKLKERFFSLFDRAPVGIYYYNEALVVEDANSQFVQMNRLDGKVSILGYPLSQYIDDNRIIQAHEYVYNGKTGHYRGPFKIGDMNEKDLFVELSTVPMFNSSGEIAGGIAIVNDITSEIAAQEKMLRSAYYDVLTNIPNRTLLMDKLSNLIAAKKRTKNVGALLFLDIDNFKKINTTFGHDTGDKALKQAVHMLEEVTGTHEMLARVSGDKFVILIANAGMDEVEAKQRTEQYVTTLQEHFMQPIRIAGRTCHLGVSIGAVLFSETKATAFDLLKRAETAMYEAKRTARGSLCFYRDSMSVEVASQLMLENDIRRAMKEDEFEMYYQPQLDVKTNSIIGAEALIRWNHPEKGLVLPDTFIPLAEESGIIIQLEAWIFERIFKDVKRLYERNDMFGLDHISINVSTVHFLEPHFVEKLMLLVRKYDVDPQWFELEITESGIIRNIEDAVRKIKELKAFGFRFSIDDFGTGYSSLSHLKELPVDVIKIDQSFVRNMSEDDEMIVEAVVAIGQKFQLGIVAEGVETQDTLQYLKAIHCDAYQGYYAHTPIDLASFKSLLDNEKLP